jgi:hypothetical protein
VTQSAPAAEKRLLAGPGWRLLPTAVVRSAGFPMDLLHPLRSPEAVTAARAVLDGERRLATLAAALQPPFRAAVELSRELGVGPQARRALSRARHAVVTRQMARRLEELPDELGDLRSALAGWNDAVTEHARLVAGAAMVWAEAAEAARLRLWELARDPRVREAIFLSNPEAEAAIVRWTLEHSRGPTLDRGLESMLVSYLQRLCAKNESASFFGPIDYARLSLDKSRSVAMSRSAIGVRRRQVFLAHWAVRALADAAAASERLRPWLALRRSPLCRLEPDGRVHFPLEGRAVAVSPDAARALALANGARTLVEIAGRLGRPVDAALALVAELERHRAARLEVVLAAGETDPTGVLLAWLRRLTREAEPERSRWLEMVGRAAALRDRFAGAGLEERRRLLDELEERFRAACGRPARRGQGTMYADRLLLFEECLGGLEDLVLGGSVAATICRAVAPVLELGRSAAAFQAASDHRLALVAWEAAGRPPSFLGYLRACLRAPGPDGAGAPELERLATELRGLVARTGGRIRSPDLPTPAPDGERRLYCSLDLMIAASGTEAIEAGDFRLVLGETHPQPLTWVFPLAHFARETLGAELLGALDAAGGWADTARVAYERRAKVHSYPLPGRVLALRPEAAEPGALAAADVEVRERDGRLSLWAEGRELRLHPQLHRGRRGVDALAALSLPAVRPPAVDLGAHTPRVEIDGLVYQRERWVVTAEELCGTAAVGFAAFLAACRCRERLGLPEEVFVRVDGEPKPVYVDLTSVPLVQALPRLVRGRGALTVTEMLPASGDLWLEREGRRYTCELRLMAVAE